MDSLERASDALSTLGASYNVYKEASALLEDGALARGPSNANGVMEEAPSKTVVGSSFLVRLVSALVSQGYLTGWC